ncbi:M23 family metallopeptidase [Corynebacterium ulcerans]|uniref:M23 family metallopeptidase n=1 Tax=Corynebacterium ulcerans TaxID=65058 RepID=UPI0005FEA937|nr:M23 family metallopeptidase [Corynebacterium ulcerans]AKA96243.1 Hypothetical protein CUL131002_0700c [Corynebacterium ulcerans]
MQQTQHVVSGKHRKQTSQAKGRVAFVALATGAVSTAGATGAALAHTTAHADTADFKLTADTSAKVGDSAPQILAIQEFKPNTNLSDQLTKAINYNEERALADEEARKPKIVVHSPASGTLTSPYGMRWGTLHAGIDIANAMHTPIYSIMDGVVIDAGPASGYGQWVRVRHNDGTVTVYGHVETINVSTGQTVAAGDQIAGMGNRGFSTGVHLHFEVHPGGGAAVDPVPWLNEKGISV